MRAIICEDNKIQRKAIIEIIENTIIRENLDLDIELETDDGNEVIEYLKEAPEALRIYFLDIELGKKLSGIEIAKKIREKDLKGYIVFITSHAEMSNMTFEYKVEALDYILKDEFNTIKERINSCIIEVYKKLSVNKNNVYSVKVGERVINLKYEDILFFETAQVKHKVRVHELNRQIEFYGSLNDLETQLDGRFIRCHKSFIINKDNVKEIDKKSRSICMKNGESCYASIREIKNLI